MKEIDELDRYRAAYKLIEKLKAAEAQADAEGWITSEDLKRELGVDE